MLFLDISMQVFPFICGFLPLSRKRSSFQDLLQFRLTSVFSFQYSTKEVGNHLCPKRVPPCRRAEPWAASLDPYCQAFCLFLKAQKRRRLSDTIGLCSPSTCACCYSRERRHRITRTRQQLRGVGRTPAAVPVERSRKGGARRQPRPSRGAPRRGTTVPGMPRGRRTGGRTTAPGMLCGSKMAAPRDGTSTDSSSDSESSGGAAARFREATWDCAKQQAAGRAEPRGGEGRGGGRAVPCLCRALAAALSHVVLPLAGGFPKDQRQATRPSLRYCSAGFGVVFW